MADAYVPVGRVSKPENFYDIEGIAPNAVQSRIALDYLGGDGKANLIADNVLPVVPVVKRNGKYYAGGREHQNLEGPQTDIGIRRDPKAPFATVERDLSQTEYKVEEYAIQEIIPNEHIKESEMNLVDNSTKGLIRQLLKEVEYSAASQIFNTSTLTSNTTLTGDDQWSSGLSNPFTAIATGKETVQLEIDEEPNTLVLGQQVYRALQRHPLVTARLKNIGGGQVVTSDYMANLFEVDRVLVGKATYNSAHEGQTYSGAFLWGKYAALCYVPSTPGVGPALGYQFATAGAEVATFPHNDTDGTGVRVRIYRGQKIMSAVSGYLIAGAIA